MKIIKAIIALAICSIVTLGAVACGGAASTKTGVEYGLVHGHYVGIITVTVKGDEITKVNIDELSTPYDWARISNINTTENTIEESDKTTNEEYTGTGTNHVYAKKIIIGDTIFTARNNGATNGYVDYFNADKNNTTTFENWLKVAANAKWYYDAMMDGDYDVVNADGENYEVEFNAPAGITADLDKTERWLKSNNGYWAAGGNGIGWIANMRAVENYIVENGFEDYTAARDTLEKNTDNVYEINGVNTGASLTDFKDYMDLAIKAHQNALNA